ncbi:MAG: hypothetical protein ACMG57_03445 [Candidatus Dojkabacteria bacterium]
MEHSGTPKPDPVIIKPVMPMVQIAPISNSVPLPINNSSSLEKFITENKKLVIAFILFLVALVIAIALLLINNQSVKNNSNNNIVSAPVSVAQASTTPPATPPSLSNKTLDIQVDNALSVSNVPYDSLKGTITLDGDVNFTNPTQYTGVFKKGTSSFTISNFHEEFEHGMIDAKFIGITPVLGNTYRVSQIGSIEGQVLYYYVSSDTLTLTGTCNPVSFPDPIAAPCGLSNYKNYYLQCSGDINFDFCDKIIKNLDFTITKN